jgi:hypothetical protein
MTRFQAKIYKLGINPLVDPPERVLRNLFRQARKNKGPIPVAGTLNGAQFIQTLVKYQGAWRLYINGRMLKDSGLKVGDVARIDVEFDPRPRRIGVPKKFADALKADSELRRRFDRLAPSRRKEILRYLNSLKSEEAVGRNVEKLRNTLLRS